jgi:IMP cyclohydrolase
MYIGRFVILGRTSAGEWYLGYRVSSRSFPNRYILTMADRAVVLPTAEAAKTDNPYISYNCLRAHGGVVVVGNGSHVDPVMDKVKAGYSLRDALSLSLLALDYEHDQYNTPRIAAGLDERVGQGYLGIVAEDRLWVRRQEVAPGQAFLVATYELTEPTPIALEGDTPEALCAAIYACAYEHPVAALAAMLREGELRMAARSARQ